MTVKEINDEFFREKLLSIYKKCNGKPIIITGIYLHSDNKKWATFVKIKPFIQNTKFKKKILCNHINISRNDINKHFTMSIIDDRQRFVIIANLKFYNYYERYRIGLELFEGNNILPLRRDRYQLNLGKMIKENCYIYSKDDLKVT